jgi:hypothetical protein
MTTAKVNWYAEDARLVVRGACAEALAAIAFQMEARTKVNIRDNGQVDTGFMLNSAYVVLPNKSTYGQARIASNARNSDREMAREARLPAGAAAAVVVGAEYAAYQEMRRSFLYRAAEQVAGHDAEAEIVRVSREMNLRE